jgi:membrane protein insertase Oxa1/YidC/SpoIIIJ
MFIEHLCQLDKLQVYVCVCAYFSVLQNHIIMAESKAKEFS